MEVHASAGAEAVEGVRRARVGEEFAPGPRPHRDHTVDIDQRAPAVELRFQRPFRGSSLDEPDSARTSERRPLPTLGL